MKDTEFIVEPGAFRLLAPISRLLTEQGLPAFLVGGCVRDTLLRRATADIDIAVGGDAVRLAPGIAAAVNGKAVTLDADNRIVRIVLPDADREIDVTSFAGDIRDDLARRDFTINAMAADLAGTLEHGFDAARLLDPFGGREDLDRRVIRAVSDGAFRDDPARLLRAVRIAGELGFDIEPGTEAIIRRDAQLIASVAGERDREELMRLLTLTGAGRHLFRLDNLGLLTALVPELAAARGTDQPLIHVWDVLEHSINTVTAVEFVLREGPWDWAGGDLLEPVPWSDDLAAHFDEPVSRGSTRRSLVKLAALLHDIAKPQTKTIDSDTGRARFLGHPNEGAAVVAKLLERLRFSKRETKLAALLVKYHMRPTQMSNEGLPTPRAIYRYFRDTGAAGTDILYLCLADHLATRGDTLDADAWRDHAALTAYVLEHRWPADDAAPPRYIRGDELIKTFGVRPGPRVGQLLESLREAQAAGEIRDRAQAEAYLKRLLRGPRPAGPDQGEL
jgi:poly(A) polymerase